MITLGVTDMAKSVAFYKDGLGFPQMASPPEVAFFTLNGSWLSLYDYQALADDAEAASQTSGIDNKEPDGYLWEVAYNPRFWVGPEDAPEDTEV